MGSEVFAWIWGTAATYDLGAGTWQRVLGGLLEPTVEANGHEYKLWRFASLVPAGEVFMEAEGITVNQNGVPCYGCSGAPTALWAYRPGAGI